MATTTQPRIAHGIARLHPEHEFPAHLWRHGPAWSLPPDRTGEWYIHSIYNAAVRVEFDEALPKVTSYEADLLLDDAREPLSAEEEKRRTEWLGWADKREAEAFVRSWTARKRREHGDIPTFSAGTYIRDGWRAAGVWHIASGRSGEPRDAAKGSKLWFAAECSVSLTVDLGDPDVRPAIAQTAEPDRVCKRCTARVAERQPATADKVTVPA
jgi:hypothetical protein